MTKESREAAALVSPSAFREHIGVRICEIHPDGAVLEAEVTEATMNYVGRLHGGVVASMVDMAGALSGGFAGEGNRVRPAVTMSFTVSYLGTAADGTIRATARRTGDGKQVFGASIEVIDETGRVIATGQGNYMYLKEPDVSG